MKQHGDGHWHGHREITQAAVERLFRAHAGPDGLIRGISRQEYFVALDKGQAAQDRALGAGLVKNFANTGMTIPYVGIGATMHSAYANPAVQANHFMADPYRRGLDNLKTNVEHIHNELTAAQAGGDDEFRRLGAAAHALQDSYSGAHAWREDSVYEGDPTAPIVRLHVFTPVHALGIEDGRNTHDGRFDMPPAYSGSTRAAVEATYRMLAAFERGKGLGPAQAELVMRSAMAPMLQASAQGVEVSFAPNRAWEAERDRRLALEQAPQQTPEAGIQPDELNRLSGVLSPHQTPAGVGPERRTGPEAGRAAPTTGRAVPATPRGVPDAGRAVPATGRGGPEVGRAVGGMGRKGPGAGAGMG